MKRWVVVAALALLFLTACEPSPQDLAEAQRIRQETADAAAAAAQQRQAAAVEIETAQRTLPARVARDNMLQMALGVAGALGLGILVVGGSATLVSWLGVRASVVYPNAAGQYPIVVKYDRLVGQTVVIDPSRAPGPVTIIQAPNRMQARIAGADAQVAQPIGTDHQTQARITTQAQAAGLLVAATRTSADPRGRQMTEAVVQAAFRSEALPVVPEPIMLDATRAPHIERLLAEPVAEED